MGIPAQEERLDVWNAAMQNGTGGVLSVHSNPPELKQSMHLLAHQKLHRDTRKSEACTDPSVPSGLMLTQRQEW